MSTFNNVCISPGDFKLSWMSDVNSTHSLPLWHKHIQHILYIIQHIQYCRHSNSTSTHTHTLRCVCLEMRYWDLRTSHIIYHYSNELSSNFPFPSTVLYCSIDICNFTRRVDTVTNAHMIIVNVFIINTTTVQ